MFVRKRYAKNNECVHPTLSLVPLVQVYAPARDNGYGSQAFPGVADALNDAIRGVGESEAAWGLVQHEIQRVARAIERAAKALTGQLI